MKIRKLLFLSMFFIIGLLLFIPNTVNAAMGDKFTVNNIEYTIIEENSSYNSVNFSYYYGNETSITVPETVEFGGKVFNVISIGDFYSSGIGYNNSVTSITIPKSIAVIRNESFSEFNKLKEFKVSEDNAQYCSFEGVLFNKDKTELIYYPKNKEGTTYTIPNTVKNINGKAFKGSILTNITIPNSISEIGATAFEGAKSLTNITIPNSVTSIGDYAFCGCISLTSITIPDSVKIIKDNVFYDCISLTEITIPKSVTDIGSNAFLDCIKLKEIKVDKDNQNYSSVDGILFNKDKTEIVCYPDNKEGTIYQIPNSVTTIGSNAFNGCKALTKIIIPNSVITIKSSAFDGCELLTSIIIPESVTTIENYVFAWCNNLKNVIIPDSVTSMEDRTFFFEANSIPLTIYCNSGSYAEQYAKDNNISYKVSKIYSITNKLTNISSDGELYTVPELGDYTVTLTANAGYKLPPYITVKIGEYNLSSDDYEYNLEDRTLKIYSDKINGNIEIEAVGEKIHKISFDANSGKFADGSNVLTFEDAENCDFNNLAIPTKNSYKFIGYYTEKTGGKSLESIMNSEAGIDKDMIFYAQWERIYSYTFVTGNNQTFTLNKFDEYSLKIDGDYTKFSKLLIGNLNLIKDVDFIVTEGSTIITFTKAGLAKLNTLAVGTYDVVVEYSNDQEVSGKLIVNAEPTIQDNTSSDNDNNGKNPQTGDNIVLFIVIFAVASIGIIITIKRLGKIQKIIRN